MPQNGRHEPCTAILNLDTLHWSKLQQKGPFIYNKFRNFFLISDEKKENIFLLGGGLFPGGQYSEIYKDLNPSLDVQRLDGNGWHHLPGSNIEYGIKWPIATVPLDFYWKNNWPKIDFSKINPPGE